MSSFLNCRDDTCLGAEEKEGMKSMHNGAAALLAVGGYSTRQWVQLLQQKKKLEMVPRNELQKSGTVIITQPNIQGKNNATIIGHRWT